MSDKTRILLVGATGLVGQSVLAELVGNTDTRLIALSRREVPMPRGARMEVLMAPAEDWGKAIATIAPDRVICTLGTTIRKVNGDEENFAAIDRDLVLDVARHSRAAGAKGFVVVSSVGANAGSKNLYLRIKGEMEAGLAKCGIPRIDILRPGLLKGVRKDDARPLEGLGKVAAPLMDLFLQGERRKYRSMKADQLARAALQCASEKAPGKFIHHYDEIMRLVGRWERN